MIGLRRENKNRWERRVPLTPDHVAELLRHGLTVVVEPSPIRVFPDESYRRAGARLSSSLADCSLVMGVKEIPEAELIPGATHLFFGHVIKGQPANMPMLRRLMEIGATLVDYEKIVDDRGRRLVFFGRFAGYAGMLDTLWALGRRLDGEGIDSPFGALKLAHEYLDLEDAHVALARVAEEIRRDGVPDALHPLVVGFTGSGNASRGAQEIFDHLPHEEVLPEDVAGLVGDRDLPRNLLYKTVFGRGDRIARRGGGVVDAAEAEMHPERYASVMGRHLDHLTVLVNGVYWEPGHPRVIGLDDVKRLWSSGAPRLRVVGDISCDLHGSIEATVRLTTPGDPVYVYDVATGRPVPGYDGRGPVILAVDNLPCELPVDASQHFGDALLRFVPPLARCDFSVPYDRLALPDELKRAVVVHRGVLTPPFAYLERHVSARSRTA